MDRSALFKLSYGIYVITTKLNNKINGFVGNTAFQITSEPPRIAVSCNKDNFTHDMIKESRVIGLSILGEEANREIIQKFGYQSGRDISKFDGIDFITGDHTGVPLLSEEGIATYEIKVEQDFSVGTHTLFIGEIVDANVVDKTANEMTYKYYHDVMKGKAPKNAPTYIDESKLNSNAEGSESKTYVCTLCGYEYIQENGAPEHGIAAGTAWEDIPDDWTCPVCGAGKELFELV